MGLDAVEIVLRTEELFAIHIEDDEAGAVRTVREFYHLICSKLNVTPLSSPVTSAELPIITHKEKKFLFLSTHTPLPAPPEVLPWSPQSVWDALVAVFVDQQGLDREEILPDARIAQDLGVD
jgi:acyl carrier protein